MTTRDASPELEQLHRDVKREVTQQAAKWLGAAVVASIGIAASGWWLYLKPKLVDLAGGVPQGAIAAFDGPNGCPFGWVPFDEAAGRVIVGTGKGQGLTERRYRELGGEESHSLTVDEMPAHTHEVTQMIGDNNVDGVDSTVQFSGEHHNELRRTGVAGGGLAHNTMPPFIVLRFCRKL